MNGGRCSRSPNARPSRRAASLPRPGRRRQLIVTETPREAIPFATTTRVLAPLGVVGNTVNFVDEGANGATDTELQSCVRA